MEVDGRKVYSVAAFNEGVAIWLARLPTLWVEGEVTELRRQDRWASVFFTLKDPENGACLAAQMPRGRFDALELGLGDGERVHVFGRPELYEQRGELRLKVLTIERFGVGAHLAALERLKRTPSAALGSCRLACSLRWMVWKTSGASSVWGTGWTQATAARIAISSSTIATAR